MNATNYNAQAADFLARFGLKLRITLSDSKPAPWEPAGHHYRITAHREPGSLKYKGAFENARPDNARNRLTFDFFGSVADAKAGTDPTEYGVLACLASESSCEDTFEEWCAEFGENPDSLKARQTFTRCSRFAARIHAFFTQTELEALKEIL